MNLDKIKAAVSEALDGVNVEYPSVTCFFWAEDEINEIPEGYEALRVEIKLISHEYAGYLDSLTGESTPIVLVKDGEL